MQQLHILVFLGGEGEGDGGGTYGKLTLILRWKRGGDESPAWIRCYKLYQKGISGLEGGGG